MSKVLENGFWAFLRKNLAGITAILSLLALAISVVQSFSAHVRTATIILLAMGTLLLIVYNVWITISIQPSILDPSLKRRQFGKRFRLTMYITSALILILCWTSAGITTSHKYFGHILFSLEKYELAAKHFNLYLKESKDDYRVYYELAKSYETLGNEKEFIETLDALLKNQNIFSKFDESDRLRKELELYVEISVALTWPDYIKGVPNPRLRALKYVEKARFLQPDNPYFLFLLGFLKASTASDRLPDPTSEEPYIKNIFKDAKKAVEKRFEEDYETHIVQYHLWFGRSLSIIGRHDQAKEELETGLEIVNKSTQEKKELRESYLLLLGMNEVFRSGDLDRANDYWNNISDQHSISTALTMSGFSLWEQGEESLKKGLGQKAKEKFASAELALSEAMKRGQRSVQLYTLLGLLYFERGDYFHASANFEEATKIDPKEFVCFYWLGRSKLYIKGGLEEARQAMTRAIELNPDNTDAHYWLGRILSDSGEIAGAFSEYEKSIEINSDNSKVYEPLLISVMSLAVEEEKHSDAQILILEKALKYAIFGFKIAKLQQDTRTLKVIDLFRPLTWSYLAYIYAERGKHLKLAMNYIENALKSDINNPYYLDTKAWIIIRTAELSDDIGPTQKQSKYEVAKELLNQSLNSLADYKKQAQVMGMFRLSNVAKAEVLFHLGYIEKLQGRDDKAQGFFLKALELDPQYEKAKEELR